MPWGLLQLGASVLGEAEGGCGNGARALDGGNQKYECEKWICPLSERL